ncbi:5'-deoxynucleotidase HDDC2-like [Clytia hemisphaerica]|uniref:5'-deoxynucleotidase HDDC2-like n=1 Tax=Clytia hemisphaerica TaxID=252671 RepID=UPI0034D55038
MAANNAVEFFMFVGQLKTEQRTGWTHHDIKNVESVSDHMYRMSMMAMLLDAPDIDKTRCMKLALVHDLAECIVGDITPYCGVAPEEKDRREREAMHKITKNIPKQIADEVLDLWEEYNKRETAEAKIVKDLDRFEMILQAFEYEKAEQRPGELEIFYNSTKGKFCSAQVISWVENLYQRRKDFIEQSTEPKDLQEDK